MAFPTPGDLPGPRTEPTSLLSPALAGRFFTTIATWEALGIAGGGPDPTNLLISFFRPSDLFKQTGHAMQVSEMKQSWD